MPYILVDLAMEQMNQNGNVVSKDRFPSSRLSIPARTYIDHQVSSD